MRVLLLAAGLGTRLRPITNTVPKCMVPIHNKPLLAYWLDMLLPSGIDRVLVNTHYLAPKVVDFINQSSWVDRIDTVYEEQLLGTGGTILKNKDYLSSAAFMVVHADNLTRFNVNAFIARHRSRPAGVDITMMTFVTDDPKSCGIIETDGNGVVQHLHEKTQNPPSNLANAAVYIFEPSVIAFLESLSKEVIDLSTEVIPEYLGRIHVFHNDDYHRDIGTPESLALAEREF